MTTRISKACHECRTRKIRCDGLQPCSHCTTRGSNCVYRAKARNRMRRVTPGGGSGARHSTTTRATSGSTDEDGDVDDGGGDGIGAGGGGAAAGAGVSGAGTGQGSQQGDGPDINIPSVAAIHGADPSRLVQVYYGPSSIFSLMNSIYHQIEGTVAANQSRQSLEEVGPGLDLFSHRRLFFGDFASGEGGSSGGTLDPMRRGVEGDAGSAMFLDRETASRFLERYLDTYWQLFPSISPAAYRQRLDDMFRPLSLFRFDTPDNVVLALALAIGADGLGEESVSCYLFSRARRGAEQLDEMVNAQMVQVYYLMAQLQLERARPNSAHLYLGSATRRAMAAGLHKEAVSRRQGSREESERKIVTVWALYFWETWTCFILGRPSSIRDPGGIASIPRDQELLRVMARLSRIVSTCVDRIYAPRHSSLLPVWTSANEIRAQLLQFAEKEPPKLGFRLTGSVHPGQLGFSQTMLSACRLAFLPSSIDHC